MFSVPLESAPPPASPSSPPCSLSFAAVWYRLLFLLLHEGPGVPVHSAFSRPFDFIHTSSSCSTPSSSLSLWRLLPRPGRGSLAPVLSSPCRTARPPLHKSEYPSCVLILAHCRSHHLSISQQFASLTASSPCTAGQNACVGTQFAQCVNGHFVLTPCAGGLTYVNGRPL